MESFNISLRVPVSCSLRAAAIEQLWGHQSSQVTFSERTASLEPFLDLYFRYYTEQCIIIGRHAKGRYSSVQTHRDILNIASLIQQRLSREEVCKHMSGFLTSADKEQHEKSIDLVARLLFMIKFGDIPHEYGGGRPIEWNQGSLPEFVHVYFSRSSTCNHDGIKLDKSFNGVNLQRIAGIEIRWTDNLADHLRMMDDDKVVTIFSHASFLEYQKQNPNFPPGFIEETLRTIALLFPKYDQATKKWYKKNAAASAYPLDLQIIKIGNLNVESRQIETFKYWHDRLVILKEVYDEARPNTLSQWWYDRRNGAQWYPFWLALWVLIFTIFFGIVEGVEGALQLYMSRNS